MFNNLCAYCEQIMQESNGTTLVSPLDWGLGHATRVIPLIHQLTRNGKKIIIAANGDGVLLLKKEFPEIPVLDNIPSYSITYPANGNFSWHFLKDSPRIMRVIRAERKWLDESIEQYRIVEVYSDNRYGLYHKKIRCHFITHQLYPRIPFFLRGLSGLVMNSYLDQFDDILVPDFKGAMNFSGALSHRVDQSSRIKFIGPLSRFNNLQIDVSVEKYAFVAMISGPEPQRQIFQNRLIELLHEINEKALVICGRPGEKRDELFGNVRIVNHLDDKNLAQVILNCELLICRSGYSTLMDLHALGKKALIIPTPGQTEQEYLAEYHHTAGRHIRGTQKNLDVSRIISARTKINFA